MVYSEIHKTSKAKLSLIIKKAKENRGLKFISLIHLLNDEEYLYECYCELEPNKAAGIDHRTKESYSEVEIRKAITDIIQQMKTRKYRPQPVRRVFISKSNGRQRPLGLPTVMDKTIQLAVKKIIEPIFEPLFLEVSYGYRPKHNAHEALKAVDQMIMKQKVNWILDADIKSFFDNVNHDWLIKSLEQRITDPNFNTLIRRMLKAGIMTNGLYVNTPQGTPQGGIISPILANIYLHYVLDLWLEKKIKPLLKGYCGMIRYADDFIIGCQYFNEAQKILQLIKDRLTKFNLTLSEDKTSVIEFGRLAQQNRLKQNKSRSQTFTFLGFTHYGDITKRGWFVVRHKTSRQKYTASVKRLKEWLRSIRNTQKLPDIWKTLSLKLKGHYRYYGISGNSRKINSFYFEVKGLAFKWLNRRSQKKSWNWKSFHEYLQRYPLPQPRIMYNIYTT